MPETAIGHFVDVGASHFLSRLPGFLGNYLKLTLSTSTISVRIFILSQFYLGEYLGLTGTRIRGEGMVACGLATHFVLSKVMPWKFI